MRFFLLGGLLTVVLGLTFLSLKEIERQEPGAESGVAPLAKEPRPDVPGKAPTTPVKRTEKKSSGEDGLIALEECRYDEARKLLLHAVEEAPEEAFPRYGLARFFAETRAPERAFEELRKIASLIREDDYLLKAKVAHLMARLALSLLGKSSAKRVAEFEYEATRHDPEPMQYRVAAARGLARTLPQSEQCFSSPSSCPKSSEVVMRTIFSSPAQDPDNNWSMGEFFFAKGKHREAIAHLERALDRVGNVPQIQMTLAESLFETGKITEARAQLDLVDWSKLTYDERRDLALLIRRLVSSDEAKTFLRKAFAECMTYPGVAPLVSE